jgi:sugar lactone lactonase YvrE
MQVLFMRLPFCRMAWLFGIVFGCLARLQGQSLSYSTHAGVAGGPGFADGTNNSAAFRDPEGLAVDNSGNLLVADTGNHTIRKITRLGGDWITKTIAGSPGQAGTNNGLNEVARFNYPSGVAVDGARGIVYVADTYNHAIRRIEATGSDWAVTTLAGNPGNSGAADGTGAGAGFFYPAGIAVDSSGWIYVADSYNHAIRLVSPTGDVTTIAGTLGAGGIVDGTNSSARFFYPSGITVAPNGRIFVADTYNNLLRQIMHVGSDWVVTTIAGVPRFPGSADGTNRAAQFDYPFGIASGSSGRLYVADTVNETIRAVDSIGTNWAVTTIGGLANAPGAADGPDSSARFDHPFAVATDTAGNLFIADSYNHTIRFGQPGVTLRGSLISGQLVLSWPASATNYILETRSSLAPGVAWTPLGGATVSGNNFVKTNPVNQAQGFFRLHAQ